MSCFFSLKFELCRGGILILPAVYSRVYIIVLLSRRIDRSPWQL